MNFSGALLEHDNGADNSDSDRLFVEQMKRGHMEALGQLYKRYSVLVQKAVIRTAPQMSQALREELVHDVFLSLMSLIDKYDSRRSFGPWIYGITVRKTLNQKRKLGMRSKLLKQRALEMQPPSVQPSACEQLEETQLLAGALSRLPEGQANVLVLHAVEGFTGEEIAQILEIELNTVWSRLHRARRALIKALDADEYVQNERNAHEM